jgi:hypothetical protein
MFSRAIGGEELFVWEKAQSSQRHEPAVKPCASSFVLEEVMRGRMVARPREEPRPVERQALACRPFQLLGGLKPAAPLERGREQTTR